MRSTVTSSPSASSYPAEALSVSLSASKALNMSNQDVIANRIRKGAQIRLIENMIRLQSELAKANGITDNNGNQDDISSLIMTKGSDLTVLSSLVRELVKHVPAAYLGGIHFSSTTTGAQYNGGTNASIVSRSTSPSTSNRSNGNSSTSNNNNGLISVTLQLWEIIVNLLYGPCSGADVDYGYTETELPMSSAATDGTTPLTTVNVFDPPTTLLYDIILFIKSILTADPYMFSTVPSLQPYGYAIMRALTATTAVPLGARTTRPATSTTNASASVTNPGALRIQIPYSSDSLLPGTLRVEVYSALGCITGSLGVNINMYPNENTDTTGNPYNPSRPQTALPVNANHRPTSAFTSSSTARNSSHASASQHHKQLASPRPWEEGAVHHHRNFRTYVSRSPERPLSTNSLLNDPPKDTSYNNGKKTLPSMSSNPTLKLSTKLTSPFAQKLRRRTAAATGRSLSNSRTSNKDSSVSFQGRDSAQTISSTGSSSSTLSTTNQIMVMYDTAKQILMNAGVAAHIADAGVTLHNLGFMEWTPHMGSSIARSMERNPSNGTYVFVNGQPVINREDRLTDGWKHPATNTNYRSATNLVGKWNPQTAASTEGFVQPGTDKNNDAQTRALYADYEVVAGPDETESTTAPEGSSVVTDNRKLYNEPVRTSLQLNVGENGSTNNGNNGPSNNPLSASTVMSGGTTVNSTYPGRAPEWFPLPSSTGNVSGSPAKPSSTSPSVTTKSTPKMTNSVVNSTGKLVHRISRAKGTVANRNAYRNEENEGLSAWMTNMGDMAEDEAEAQRQARTNKYLQDEIETEENAFAQLGNYAEEEAEAQRQARAMKYLTAAVEQEDTTLSSLGLLAEDEATEEREARAAKYRSSMIEEEENALNALAMYATDEAETERAKRIASYIQSATSEEENILSTMAAYAQDENSTGSTTTAGGKKTTPSENLSSPEKRKGGSKVQLAPLANGSKGTETTAAPTTTGTVTTATNTTTTNNGNKLASIFKGKMMAENLAKDRLPKLRATLQERKSKAKALAEAAAAAAKAVKDARQRAQKIMEDEKIKATNETTNPANGESNENRNNAVAPVVPSSSPEVIQAQADVLATEIEAAAMMRAANLAIKAVEETAIEVSTAGGDKDSTVAAVQEILPIVPPASVTVTDTTVPPGTVPTETGTFPTETVDDAHERAERCRQYLDALQADEDETLLALAAYANTDNDVTTEASVRITAFLKAIEKEDKSDTTSGGSSSENNTATSPAGTLSSPTSPLSPTVKSPSKGLMSFASSVFTRMRLTKITRNQLPRLRAQLAAKKVRALALGQAAAAAALAAKEAKQKAEEARAQVAALTQSIEETTLITKKTTTEGEEEGAVTVTETTVPSGPTAENGSSSSSATLEQQQEELRRAEALVTIHETSARIADAEVNAFLRAADNAITEVKQVDKQIATEIENNPAAANTTTTEENNG